MTAGEHSCTRRALLGAAVGVAGVGADLSPPSPSHRLRRRGPLSPLEGEGFQEWEAALAELDRAEVGLRVVERGTRGLSFADAEAVQGAYDARCDAWEAALVRAMILPAPDLGAFAAKVIWVVDLGVAEFGAGRRVWRRFGRMRLGLEAIEVSKCDTWGTWSGTSDRAGTRCLSGR